MNVLRVFCLLNFKITIYWVIGEGNGQDVDELGVVGQNAECRMLNAELWNFIAIAIGSL